MRTAKQPTKDTVGMEMKRLAISIKSKYMLRSMSVLTFAKAEARGALRVILDYLNIQTR
jgi:hypothetical protein